MDTEFHDGELNQKHTRKHKGHHLQGMSIVLTCLACYWKPSLCQNVCFLAIKEDHSLEDVDALDYSIDEEKPEGDEALEIEASHSDQADFEDGDEPVEKETKKSEKVFSLCKTKVVYL